MSKKRPDYLIAPGTFDDLVVIELDTDGALFSRDARGKLLEELRSPDNTMPFLPASSCTRHVYLMRKSDIAASNNVVLKQPVLKGIEEDKIHVHSGNAAMKHLVEWFAGGLNEGKYYHDTYNRKTVQYSFQSHHNLCTIPQFAEVRIPEINDEIAALSLQLAEAKEKAVKEAIESLEAKIKWLEVEKKEIKRIEGFNIETSAKGDF